MTVPVLFRLSNSIEAERGEVANALLEKPHESIADVRYLQGMVEALSFVLVEIEHARKALYEDEEGEDGGSTSNE